MAELNDLERLRLEKAAALRRAGLEPYPTTARRTHTTVEALQAFEAAPEWAETAAASVGRLRSVRHMGNVTFAHVEDGHGRLQLYLRADELGAESTALFADQFDLGDFVEAEGMLFRTPEEGWVFLASDYSQVELRILAHLCGDPELCQAFRRGEDIHRVTASKVFGVPQDRVTDAIAAGPRRLTSASCMGCRKAVWPGTRG